MEGSNVFVAIVIAALLSGTRRKGADAGETVSGSREQLSAQDAEQLRAMIRAYEAENGLTAAPDGAEGASAAPEAGTARTGEAEG